MIVPPQTGSIEGAWSPSTSKKIGRVQENGQGPGNHVFLNVDRNPKKIIFFKWAGSGKTCALRSGLPASSYFLVHLRNKNKCFECPETDKTRNGTCAMGSDTDIKLICCVSFIFFVRA